MSDKKDTKTTVINDNHGNLNVGPGPQIIHGGSKATDKKAGK